MQSTILLVSEKKNIEEFLRKNFSKEDIIVSLSPEKNEYSINQIRNLQQEVKYFNPKKRIYVFYEFERSSLESQNAFLKLLEEPPSNVYFILVCQNLYRLLPTVISRAKVIDLKNKAEEKENEKIEKVIEKIKKGELFFVDVTDRNEAKELTLFLIYYFKKELKGDLKVYQILKEAVKNLFLLENNYLNPQLTLDNLLIFIYKYYNKNINE
jgi:DNA polymerase III delta prime subunit